MLTYKLATRVSGEVGILRVRLKEYSVGIRATPLKSGLRVDRDRTVDWWVW